MRLRGSSGPRKARVTRSRGLASDLGLGSAVSLGNPKPVVFYGALLSAFLDPPRSGIGDFGVLVGVVAVVSFLVYGACMVIAQRAGRLLVPRGAARGWIRP